MADISNIEDIIIKFLKKEQTTDEQVALEQWIAASENNKLLFEQLTDQRILEQKLQAFHRIELTKEHARKGLITSKVRTMFSWSRVAAAAVLIIIFAVGGYFYFNKNDEKQIAKTEVEQKIKHDISAPKSNKAVLILEDGSTIVLDSASNGSLAMQGNVKVEKTKDGQIVYKGSASEIKFNTISNPKGSKPVQLQLADGSNVWLNVASSITYPTAFVGKERKIKITGEGYFEVAHNTAMPFIVEKNDVSVQVLGTHFNVNTYDDESAIRITLLEGSVKISKGSQSNVIKPGQQAQVSSDIKIVAADIDETMAWKNGLFSFNKVDLQTVLRQLTKWYDVEVAYEGNVPKQTFGGDIERTLSLSQVLKVLEKSEVHFRIDGKKIIVTK